MYGTDANALVVAPTGSGKTGVMELAMVRLLGHHAHNARIVYLAPTRALCAERERDWHVKFPGFSCVAVTSDQHEQDAVSVCHRSHIVVTTPEKWDAVTRKSSSLRSHVHLLLVDELHSIGCRSRGATLEIVLMRASSQTRIVAVSATLPNIHDLAHWLNAKVLHFDESYRPVQLKRVVIGHRQHATNNDFQFEQSLDQHLFQVLEKYGQGKSALVFCSTRNHCHSACTALIRQATQTGFPPGTQYHPFVHATSDAHQLNELANSLHDKKLAALVVQGIAFHHGNLRAHDRDRVEKAFLAGWIRVICTTSTLAVGVNLPAYLVVIKGTRQYTHGQYEDYSDLDLLQMMGRAGRPQFEQSAVAVIMTSQDKKSYFEGLVEGRKWIESQLHRSLPDFLNVELAMRSLTHAEMESWLKTSFLWVRYTQNPDYYFDIVPHRTATAANSLLDYLHSCVAKLIESELVACSAVDGKYAATASGSILSRHHIPVETMTVVRAMKPQASIRELLMTLAQSPMFADVRIQQGEKGILNDANNLPDMRYPLSGKVSTVADKIYVLIQGVLGSLGLKKLANNRQAGFLETEANKVIKSADNICRFILQVHLSYKQRDVITIRNACELSKCLRVQLWDDASKYPKFQLRQLKHVGPAMTQKWAVNGIRTLSDLEQCDELKIESVTGRNPPFGRTLLAEIQKMPKLEMDFDAKAVLNKPGTIDLKCEVRLKNHAKVDSQSRVSFITYVFPDTYVDYRRLKLSQFGSGSKIWTLQTQVKTDHVQLACHAIFDAYIGLDVKKVIEVDVVIPKAPVLSKYRFEPMENLEPFDFPSDSDFEPPIVTDKKEPTVLMAQHESVGVEEKKFSATGLEVENDVNGAAMAVMECHHRCSNKGQCGHLCCRNGLFRPGKRTTSKPANKLLLFKKRRKSKKEKVNTPRDDGDADDEFFDDPFIAKDLEKIVKEAEKRNALEFTNDAVAGKRAQMTPQSLVLTDAVSSLGPIDENVEVKGRKLEKRVKEIAKSEVKPSVELGNNECSKRSARPEVKNRVVDMVKPAVEAPEEVYEDVSMVWLFDL